MAKDVDSQVRCLASNAHEQAVSLLSTNMGLDILLQMPMEKRLPHSMLMVCA